MVSISQIIGTGEFNTPSKTDDIIRKAKISNIARLAKMLVDLFGMDDPFKKIGDQENPIAKVIINVKEDQIIRVLSQIIRSKANLFGILKLLKYLIPRKIVIKGSYLASIKLTRCLMIGKHDVFKKI